MGPPGGEDFSLMFKESIRSVQPGDVRAGRFVNVGPEFVAVSIGYKSEGHIPLAEFRQRDGQATVSKGDAVDVCFDSANSDQESIVLSRAKAEQFGIWRDIQTAFNTEVPIKGKSSARGKAAGASTSACPHCCPARTWTSARRATWTAPLARPASSWS